MHRFLFRHLLIGFLVAVFAIASMTCATAQELDGLGLPGFGSGGQQDADTVTVDAEILPGANGGPAHLLITAKIIPGWHIGSITQKPGGPKKTELKLDASNRYRATGTFLADPAPTIKNYEIWKVSAEEHYGAVTWRLPIELPPQVKIEDVIITGSVAGQACKEACILFESKFEARAADGAAARAPAVVQPPAQPVVIEPSIAAEVLNSIARAEPPFVAGNVTVSGQFNRLAAAPGEKLQLQIRFQPQPGWHVYELLPQLPAKASSRPTLIGVDQRSGLRFSPPLANEPLKATESTDSSAKYYDGAVTMTLEVEVPKAAAPGLHQINGMIAFQTCQDKRCEGPVGAKFTSKLQVAAQSQQGITPLQITEHDRGYMAVADAIKAAPRYELAPAGTKAPSQSSSWIDELDLYVVLAIAFLAGFILNFMPCVLPVIGLKIVSFVQQAGENRQRILALNLWFSLGLMSVFWVLATVLAFVSIGWGQHYSIASFNIVLTSIVFAFALSFLGVWEIPIPGFVGTSSANEVAEKEGATGAFVKGILATVLATPCTGPLLIPATTWAFKQPMGITYLAFTFIGLGMASPYLIIGAFPRLIAFLPKPGAWMEAFKQIMGFVLMGTVVWLLSSLQAEYHSATLTLFVAIAFGCWSVGRVPLTAELSTKVEAWTWAIGAIVYVVLVGYVGNQYVTVAATMAAALGVGAWIVSRIPDAANVARQLWGWLGAGVVVVLAAAASYVVIQWSQLPWQPFTRTALNDLRNRGRTVLVDFTADW